MFSLFLTRESENFKFYLFRLENKSFVRYISAIRWAEILRWAAPSEPETETATACLAAAGVAAGRTSLAAVRHQRRLAPSLR